MAKTKPETVAATDETTLPVEGQTEAPAPVVEGADIPQGDMGIAMSAEGDAQAADPVALEATADAPVGEPVADEPVPVMDTAPEGANIHGIGPDVGGGPNPDYDPDAAGKEGGPELWDNPTIADNTGNPVALPDPDLLRTLVASIERRNTSLHRPALMGELVVLGASIEGQTISLAGVRAEAVSEDEGLLLTNWCMAARQQLAVIDDV
jgi:hypothetical protein